jgi:hypothetical protein
VTEQQDSAGDTETSAPGSAAALDNPRRQSPIHRRWWLWGLAVLGVACAVVAVLAVVASRYQPVSYGSFQASAFPGIPSGNGIRAVNNLGGFHEDLYIPPQRGTFGLFADITNNGTYPVTIVSVRLPVGSLRLAGPVRYSMPGMGGSQQIPPPVSRVLHRVVLQPGQEMFLGFPVWMWPCTAHQGWEGLESFYVKVKYLMFTHTVEVPWGMDGDSLLIRAPGGKPGHKGVTCAPGTTLANLPKVPAEKPSPHAVAGTIIRVRKDRDVGELRLIQMTMPDAAAAVGPRLPACFTQYSTDLAHRPHYRVIDFDLNWAAINFGQRGIAPAVRATIAGPDGTAMLVAVPEGPGANRLACRAARSFRLGRETSGWQLVYGLTLRVPLNVDLDHLFLTVDGHTITVPLVPACGTKSAGPACFLGDQLGGDWISGSPYSIFLRI